MGRFKFAANGLIVEGEWENDVLSGSVKVLVPPILTKQMPETKSLEKTKGSSTLTFGRSGSGSPRTLHQPSSNSATFSSFSSLNNNGTSSPTSSSATYLVLEVLYNHGLVQEEKEVNISWQLPPFLPNVKKEL